MANKRDILVILWPNHLCYNRLQNCVVTVLLLTETPLLQTRLEFKMKFLGVVSAASAVMNFVFSAKIKPSLKRQQLSMGFLKAKITSNPSFFRLTYNSLHYNMTLLGLIFYLQPIILWVISNTFPNNILCISC